MPADGSPTTRALNWMVLPSRVDWTAEIDGGAANAGVLVSYVVVFAL
jgi:hypothetical protein